VHVGRLVRERREVCVVTEPMVVGDNNAQGFRCKTEVWGLTILRQTRRRTCSLRAVPPVYLLLYSPQNSAVHKKATWGRALSFSLSRGPRLQVFGTSRHLCAVRKRGRTA
jgi:hypothetical protein